MFADDRRYDDRAIIFMPASMKSNVSGFSMDIMLLKANSGSEGRAKSRSPIEKSGPQWSPNEVYHACSV